MPVWIDRRTVPHAATATAVAATAPANWPTTYPAASTAVSRPCRVKASVTLGLMCAPLRLPGGVSAQADPLPA